MVRYDWVVKYDLDIICLVRYDEEWMIKNYIQLVRYDWVDRYDSWVVIYD